MRILYAFIFILLPGIPMAQHASVNALDFNGTSDYVEIPHNSAFNPGTNFTVEAWINADAWASQSWQNTIVSKDMWSSISEGWVIRCGNSGRVSFNLALNSNGNWYEIISGPLLTTGKWYHVAGTYNGTIMRLFVNGKEAATLTQAGTITPTTAPVKLGNIAMTGQSRYFNGKIDEVRIWKTDLSEATIRQYMCRRLDATHPNYNNLIANYKLNAGTGSVIHDSGPSAYNGTRYGPVWTVSGAPLGDKSANLYPVSWTGQQFKFGHPNGDSVNISSVTNSPQGIHIYYIDSMPNYTTTPAGVVSFYPSRYYGVYPTSGSSVTFTDTYYYDGYPGISNQGKLNLSHRTDNADSTWAGITVTLDTLQKTIIRTAAVSGEFILGRNDEINPFMLNSPANNSVFTIQGGAGQTIPFNWFSTETQKGAKPEYRWLLDHDTADFSTPLSIKLSSSAGADTTLPVNYIDLAVAMASAGLFYGDTLHGKWTVRATAGPIIRHATSAFDIDIVRGILSSDLMYSFTLDQPDNDTIEVMEGGDSLTVFNWKRAKSTAGTEIGYNIDIAGYSGNLSTPLGTFTADQSGMDTLVTLTDSVLADMIKTAGIPKGQTYQFKWRAKAAIGLLTGYSSDSNYVYMRWVEDPFKSVGEIGGESNITVYPNPAADKVHIVLNSQTRYDLIQLLDFDGRLLQTAKPENGSAVMELPSDLSNGIYILRVSGESGNIQKRLAIISH